MSRAPKNKEMAFEEDDNFPEPGTGSEYVPGSKNKLYGNQKIQEQSFATGDNSESGGSFKSKRVDDDSSGGFVM